MSKLKAGAGAVVLALVLFGMSGGAEADASTPPPPPYDWDAVAVDFAPFWAIGGPRTDGHVFTTPMAKTPAEGRALCDYHKRWDYPNDARWGCKVVPYQGNPVFGPQWAGAS